MIPAHRLLPFALFSSLDDKARGRMAEACERRHFERGQMLIVRGDPADAFFLVEYGRIKVYRSTSDGREQVLHVVEGWQSFAEVAVLSMENYPASAQALEESACIVVPRAPFLALVDDTPAAARAMLAGQATWLRRLVDQNTSLMLEDVVTRLARYLVIYAETHDIVWEDGAYIDLQVKKSVIASQIGTVPETLARNIKKLTDMGMLERENRGLILRDAKALYGLAYAR